MSGSKFLFAAGRSARKEGGFDARSRTLMAAYLRHLQQSFQIRLRLAESASRERNLESALNLYRYGVVLLDRTKHVVYANIEAESLLRHGRGLYVRHRKLHMDNPELAADFHHALDLALAFPGKTQARARWIFRVGIRRDGSQVEVLVRPVDITPESFADRTAKIAVYVIDSCPAEKGLSDVLASLYRLTSAETRCAELLCEGESVQGVAEKCKLSRNTVRVHLQNIFLKTATRRQGELIALLSRNVAGVARHLKK